MPLQGSLSVDHLLPPFSYRLRIQLIVMLIYCAHSKPRLIHCLSCNQKREPATRHKQLSSALTWSPFFRRVYSTTCIRRYSACGEIIGIMEVPSREALTATPTASILEGNAGIALRREGLTWGGLLAGVAYALILNVVLMSLFVVVRRRISRV